MAALPVPYHRLPRLELVDGDDLAHVLVQLVDDLHLVVGQLKVVHLQVVQELRLDDALQGLVSDTRSLRYKRHFYKRQIRRLVENAEKLRDMSL